MQHIETKMLKVVANICTNPIKMLKVLANIFTNPGKHLANICRNPSKHLASICTNIWKLQCSIFSATSEQTLQKRAKDAEMLPLKYMIEWNI